MCKPIVCREFRSEELCLSYSGPEYRGICDWNENTEVYAGNGVYLTGNDTDPYCYNNCTEGFEIVLTIDTSSSVLAADREQQVEALVFIVTGFWEVIDTKSKQAGENTYDLLKFALITYGRNVRLHFGLDNTFTTLDDYINTIVTVFENDVVYEDDTNTVGALIESVEQFEDSTNIDPALNISWTRLQVLFTGMKNIIRVLCISLLFTLMLLGFVVFPFVFIKYYLFLILVFLCFYF